MLFWCFALISDFTSHFDKCDRHDGQQLFFQAALPGRTMAPGAGQRQTRELLSQDAGIEPIARINGRIQNRVQSRIRNRIDRYYSPQANAASPFEVAGDQVHSTGRPQR